jgi:hypothetical protein
VKIALCIPAHRQTESKFTQALTDMVIHTCGATIQVDGEKVKPELKLFIVSSSLLTESRNRLVAEAIHWEADFMLWMDADHVFPCDALIRLLNANKLVVGCNYARRHVPTAPTASKRGSNDEMELIWTTRETAEAGELEEVAHLGLGLCLIDMRAFAYLEMQAEKEGKEHFWPLFRIDPTPDGIRFVGEDVYFFKKLREAGIKVFLDHGLSWEVGHLHETVLTNAHCEVQKDSWIEFSKHKLDKFRKEEA